MLKPPSCGAGELKEGVGAPNGWGVPYEGGACGVPNEGVVGAAKLGWPPPSPPPKLKEGFAGVAGVPNALFPPVEDEPELLKRYYRHLVCIK